MYILSDKLFSEFIATPVAARCVVSDEEHAIPAFLVKAETVILKYLVKGCRFYFRIEYVVAYNFIIYGIYVEDDPISPLFIWASIESQLEINALKRMMQAQECYLYLFNEGAMNIAQAKLYLKFERDNSHIFDEVSFGLFISEQSFYKVTQKYEFFDKEEVDRNHWFYANKLWFAKNDNKLSFGKIDFIPFEFGFDENDLDKKIEGTGCLWFMGGRGPIVFKDIESQKKYIAVATASRYNEFEDLKLIKDGISFSVDNKKFELERENNGWRLLEK